MDLGLTVAVHNQYTLKTIDVNTGAIKVIRQVGGKIVQGPVVTGDLVSCIVETPSGKTGKVFKLPNLIVTKTFSAS